MAAVAMAVHFFFQLGDLRQKHHVYKIRKYSKLSKSSLFMTPLNFVLIDLVQKQSIMMSFTQGNCATEGNSGNCQSGNCHSGERWMRKPSVHGGKWKSNEGIDNIANGPVNNMSFFML